MVLPLPGILFVDTFANFGFRHTFMPPFRHTLLFLVRDVVMEDPREFEIMRPRTVSIHHEAVTSWVLLRRIQSECLPLESQRAGVDLLSEELLEIKVAIGSTKGELILKLNGRKRTCICAFGPQGSLELRVPQLYCPVFMLRPAIVECVPAGWRRRMFATYVCYVC